ncbi:MAG: hypothetical protein ACK4WH_11290 [Phycisphaerales bacterium]
MLTVVSGVCDSRAQCTATTGLPIKVATGPLGGTLTVVQCLNSGDPIIVNVSGLSGSRVIHVYDSTGSPPSLSVGAITILGQSATLTAVAVLIAGTSQGWTDDSAVSLQTGATSFGGLTVEESDTRSKTRVSASVSGSITGSITANQIVRIQTDNSVDDDLIATGAGPFVGTTTRAIGQVRAGHAIRGDIRAEQGDIFAIRVLNTSPLPDAEGLSGNVYAEGNIATIYSTGRIGPINTNAIKILAGGRIEQVRTSADSISADPLDKDIIADIGTGVDAMGNELDTSLMALTGNSKLDSPLCLLQTAGDFEGNLNLANLAVTPTWPSSAPAGVLVGGRLVGNINIRFNLDHSKIIAQNMAEAFFNIGLRMTGAIVEFRRDQGDRTLDFNGPTFTIGYGTPPTEYTNEIRGTTGSNCPPVDMTETDWWFETPDCDGRTFDSLIRFSSTKGIDIRRMTLEITPNTHKAYFPRIEFIAAREMRIGTDPPEADASMEAGVV